MSQNPTNRQTRFRALDGAVRPAPFDASRRRHRAAYERAMAEHMRGNRGHRRRSAPTFDNTVGALERAGEAMNRVGGVFWNYTGTESTPELQAIERDLAPKIAAHFRRSA